MAMEQPLDAGEECPWLCLRCHRIQDAGSAHDDCPFDEDPTGRQVADTKRARSYAVQ